MRQLDSQNKNSYNSYELDLNAYGLSYAKKYVWDPAVMLEMLKVRALQC